MYDILGALKALFEEVHYMEFLSGHLSGGLILRSAVSMRTGNIMV